MQPQGIQRRRIKGWRKPAMTICVTRPGRWGNPFTAEEYGRKNAIEMYRQCVLNNEMVFSYLGTTVMATQIFEHFKWISENLHLLRDKNLACYCALDQNCHRSVLLELANK